MTAVEYILPDVGEGLTEGEIVRWLVATGDEVARDQIIAEVQTDKSIIELPAPVAGVVASLGGEEGDLIPVGGVVATFESADAAPNATAADHGASEAAGTSAPAAPSGSPQPAPASAAPSGSGQASGAVSGSTSSAPPAQGKRRVLAAPATRKLALELGVDLARVTGSGPGGRVTREDVEQAAAGGPADGPVDQAPAPAGTRSAPPAPRAAQPDETVALRGVRRSIAKAMQTSWSQVPHITDFREIDATALVGAREALRERGERVGVRVTYLALFVKIVASVLPRHPKFRASVDMAAETVTYRGAINVGIATATPDGLIVPVVRDADQLSLFEVAQRIEDLVRAARERTLSHEQSSGGTFTITSTGPIGGRYGNPIIRPPESGIACLGGIEDGVIPVGGVPAVRPVLPLSVAADHRIIDGQDLGLFTSDLAELLTDPVLVMAGDA